jgi:cell division protein FtsX
MRCGFVRVYFGLRGANQGRRSALIMAKYVDGTADFVLLNIYIFLVFFGVKTCLGGILLSEIRLASKYWSSGHRATKPGSN